MVDAPLHFCADIDRLERVLRAEKKRFSAIFNSFETILAGLKACAGDVEALSEALVLPPLSLMQSFNEVEGRLTTARKALNYGKLDIDRYEEVTDALRDVNHFITTMGKSLNDGMNRLAEVQQQASSSSGSSGAVELRTKSSWGQESRVLAPSGPSGRMSDVWDRVLLLSGGKSPGKNVRILMDGERVLPDRRLADLMQEDGTVLVDMVPEQKGGMFHASSGRHGFGTSSFMQKQADDMRLEMESLEERLRMLTSVHKGGQELLASTHQQQT